MIFNNILYFFIGILLLIGTVLTVFFSGWFMSINIFVAINLIQYSFTGFCPAEKLLIKIFKRKLYCFVTDNENCWYFIPVREKNRFENLKDDEYDTTIILDYGHYRCLHPVNYMFIKKEVLKENV